MSEGFYQTDRIRNEPKKKRCLIVLISLGVEIESESEKEKKNPSREMRERKKINGHK
jgi:hypothetical protein